ncbi:hypothetical protein D1610_12095 [Sphingomonas gilva]|uniref:Uncharacterized protein n=1 Tax=Sphingomonas gilva TaxID=2305907 RepID=A0A396RSF9_9SPHN|nr:hypothetical protein [Sphingomonas gilva]RHW17273.1 hypothetical protein D1610_12095 [Sphingomonas gilva]
MSNDPMNLTGAWFGSFSYLGTGDPDVSFIASLEEVAGVLSGTTSEPNTIAGTTTHLNAFIRGSREGAEVSFTKMYDGESDAAHAVNYAGTVNAEGTRVSGFWQLEEWSGGFEMTRTQVQEEELEEVEMAEEPAFANLVGR